MKKTYIVIIILVLIALGFWFFGSTNKTAQAPLVGDNTNDNSAVVNELNKDQKVVSDTNNDSNPDPQLIVMQNPVKEFTVSGQNFSFSPSTITVQKGDVVKINFKNLDGNHNFALDEFQVKSKIIKGGEEDIIQFIADKTGSFQYYCSSGPHRVMGMWGTLKVE